MLSLFTVAILAQGPLQMGRKPREEKREESWIARRPMCHCKKCRKARSKVPVGSEKLHQCKECTSVRCEQCDRFFSLSALTQYSRWSLSDIKLMCRHCISDEDLADSLGY